MNTIPEKKLPQTHTILDANKNLIINTYIIENVMLKLKGKGSLDVDITVKNTQLNKNTAVLYDVTLIFFIELTLKELVKHFKPTYNLVLLWHKLDDYLFNSLQGLSSDNLINPFYKFSAHVEKDMDIVTYIKLTIITVNLERAVRVSKYIILPYYRGYTTNLFQRFFTFKFTDELPKST